MKILLIILTLCLSACAVENTAQSYWVYTEIKQINSPKKCGCRDWEIIWENDHGVEDHEYQEDTTGLGYYVGLRQKTLIRK